MSDTTSIPPETIEPKFYTNIEGKIRNTKLPVSKPLWPLFEAISNSIHAIEERQIKNGQIEIKVIRNGDQDVLKELANIEQYPINGFVIRDNGVGFTDKNFESFLTAESDYKIEKGAKGIGRFVCLKAFKSVRVDSIYSKDDKLFHRQYDFKPTGNAITEYKNVIHSGSFTGTRVSLIGFKEDYQKNCTKNLSEIGEKIVEHFLVLFLLDKCPLIKLVEINGTELLLKDLYTNEIKHSIQNKPFKVRHHDLNLFLLKIFNTNTKHSLHFCANDREVMNENLSKLLPDLGNKIKNDDEGNTFTYQAYITGKYLNDNVNSERIGFDFPKGEDEDLIYSQVTETEIRTEALKQIEELLKSYLTKIREDKFSEYKGYIEDEGKQYASLLKYRPEKISEIPPGLKGNRLNIELFKIQSELEVEVKEMGEEFLKPKEDITDLDDYKRKYEEYIEKFNDIGKANLAKYIVHRKAVINLLEQYLGQDENGDFLKEDTIHNIFFPIKSESDEVAFDKQNLWLIDERLSYHSYLASDKAFNSIEMLNSDSRDRTDLLIFNDSFAFINDEAPHQSFVIVEFKRPERGSYSETDEKKNPVDQVVSYIRTIRECKATDRRGKVIQADKERTPFYAYVVCDFNPKLTDILETRNYRKTPDGMGYYFFHDTYNAYIEVISYQKLLKDSKNRNKILFDKLGLP